MKPDQMTRAERLRGALANARRAAELLNGTGRPYRKSKDTVAAIEKALSVEDRRPQSCNGDHHE